MIADDEGLLAAGPHHTGEMDHRSCTVDELPERIPVGEFLELAGIETVEADGQTMFRTSESGDAAVSWIW